jgi:hypothetical protein
LDILTQVEILWDTLDKYPKISHQISQLGGIISGIWDKSKYPKLGYFIPIFFLG